MRYQITNISVDQTVTTSIVTDKMDALEEVVRALDDPDIISTEVEKIQ